MQLGPFEELVLLAIPENGEQYGAEIRRAVECIGSIQPGSVQTTLNRLEHRGVLTSREVAAPLGRGSRYRRYYRLTELGGSVLRSANMRRLTVHAYANQDRRAYEEPDEPRTAEYDDA